MWDLLPLKELTQEMGGLFLLWNLLRIKNGIGPKLRRRIIKRRNLKEYPQSQEEELG